MRNRDNQEKNQQEIVVVDDSLTSLRFLTDILEDRGYLVRPASNGLLALETVAARLPDLILLDVKMPDMDGYEVCLRLKSDEHSCKVPVIFISAFGGIVEKIEGFKAGGVDYITKPFEREEVLARVGTHLRLRELTEHLEQEVNQRTAELYTANEQLQRELAERKQAEQTIALLSFALDNVREAAFLIDENARFHYVNQDACRVLGYTRDELLTLGVPDIDPDFPVERWTGHWNELKTQRSLLFEGRHRAKDGRVFPVEISANYFEHDGRGYNLALVRNITERKQAEEELASHREHLEELVQARTSELEAANKELEGFVYSISHDLRAPLRHIDGFMELLKKKAETALDEKSRHYMDKIADSAKRMGTLIDDLLSFSRMGRHQISKQHVDLNELTQETIREFEPENVNRDIHWRVDDLPVVAGDRAMLRMVLFNLISNALKFTRPVQQAEIEIGSMPDTKTETIIFVRDNGVGFDMNYADKLFSVFQRLHRVDEFEGTGIGLANVRRIIARHGGRTWAEGKNDQGATFYFSLP